MSVELGNLNIHHLVETRVTDRHWLRNRLVILCFKVLIFVSIALLLYFFLQSLTVSFLRYTISLITDKNVKVKLERIDGVLFDSYGNEYYVS